MRRTDSPDSRLIRRTMLRIALQSALAVAVTVALLCAVATLVVLNSQKEQQNSLLDTAIQRADDVSDPPAGTWLIAQRDGVIVASPGLPKGLPDMTALNQGIAGTEDYRVHEREYRVRTEPRGDIVIQAVLDLRSAHEERGRLLQGLLIAGAAGLLLAALTGAWVGRRSVMPLVSALALQRRFVADAGHELRTPLTLLSTRAQLLQRRVRNSPWESDVDGLVEDARQLTAILEDLLLAADPREDAPRSAVDLGALVRQAVGAAEPAASERSVRLEVEGDSILVLGYEAGLRRAVNALLDNGIRHARSLVRVTVAREGRRARIEVADDGPGIDTAILPTLFTRFASAPGDGAPGERRRYGLGLSLVSEIAARHGGSVSATNPDSGGAALSLSLPVQSATSR
ncbi:HAMP domain-containing histidine kinase [Amycolatopsis sp. K13G38]|uniref:histidine kinase n=1 Tax=Amycolatopsis acididurans TaxID=2724524 RepID=A0ABX1JFV0_9PSEU|nr:HAMP domain-containing sensor histidine kinase [Amycolatopsis acididurans]NKQ57391.1 HAMP domain-containing histidine kinase [Amycolatopsis acididurans]